MRIQYLKDDNNNDILQDDSGKHQVMMEWEKDYMIELINKLKPTGKVLEIGFGYSANAIIQNDITDYTINECSPEVWKRVEQFKKDNPNKKIKLIKGRWEDVLYTSEKYDTIFFDDYSYENDLTRFDIFLKKVVKNHTNVGSRIGVYSTNPQVSNKFECLSLECEKYNVDIPKDCNYASGKCMYIPIYTKISEMTDNDKKLKPPTSTNIINNFKAVKSTPPKDISVKFNLAIIDNFYSNPDQVRSYALSQEFNVLGNYPGRRTLSDTNESVRDYIQKYMPEPITYFNTSRDETNYNGAFQYTTCEDRSWIHTDYTTKWAAVLYLTPNAPLSGGTGIFRTKTGITYETDNLNVNCRDMTKWEMVDRIGNVYNRLVIFNSKQYHMSLDYFGDDKNNGRLFQTFFFN